MRLLLEENPTLAYHRQYRAGVDRVARAVRSSGDSLRIDF
jgi:hypothetical protein